MVRFLNSEDIDAVLTPKLCVDALEEAFADLGDRTGATMIGREVIAARVGDRDYPGVADRKAYYSLEVQTGAMPRYGVAAMRLKSDMVHWPQSATGYRRDKVPAAPGDQYCGLIMLFSITTVEPVALMPDGLIQRLRVGGTSALGAKYMAQEDAKVMGLIGAGWQAGAQVLTTHEVRRLEKVKVFSPTRSRRDAFAGEMRERLGIAVEPVGSPQEAAQGADILHSATNSRVPTITPDMVSPGVHLGVISVEEVDERVVRRADMLGTSRRKRLAYSHWAIANGSATDIHEAEFDHGWWKDEALMDDFVELGEMIHGRAQGRRAASDITFFVSGGAAIQFAAVGGKVLEAARAQGLGREVPVEWFLQPYHP